MHSKEKLLMKSTTRRSIYRILYLAIFGVIIASVNAYNILQKPEIDTEITMQVEEESDTVTNSRYCLILFLYGP